MRKLTLADLWDILLFGFALPFVAIFGLQLPGDWAHHEGRSLTGTATVSHLSSTRGTYSVEVDVRNKAGRVVAKDTDFNGDIPDRLGATVPAKVFASGFEWVHSSLRRGLRPF